MQNTHTHTHTHKECPPQSNRVTEAMAALLNPVNSTDVSLVATTPCRLQLDSVVQLGQQAHCLQLDSVVQLGQQAHCLQLDSVVQLGQQAHCLQL